jgi:hypothetical protein
MLGKAERMTILGNNDRAHETLRNRILLPEIPRAEERHQRTSSSFRPSLPPYPHTPSHPHTLTPVRVLTVSGAAGAKANS